MARHHRSSNRSGCERRDERENGGTYQQPLIFHLNALSHIVAVGADHLFGDRIGD
jgi:hypothetical protein